MTAVHFENFGDDETVIYHGIFIARCLDGDSEERIRFTTIGDPAIWDEKLLVDAARDRIKERMKPLWGD